MSLWFGILYYWSSLAPQYLMIMILLFLQYVNCSKNVWVYVMRNHFILFYIILIFFAISLICIVIIALTFRHFTKETRSGLYGVHLSYKVNPGFGAFFLNSLIPIIAVFPSISKYPSTSFIIIVFFQFLIFIFYRISSDIIPNLPLSLVGYNVYIISKLEKCKLQVAKGHMTYIIGRSKFYNRRMYCGHDEYVISFKGSDPHSIFAFIKNCKNKKNK